jgi:putative flippase GtrA
MRQPLFFLAVGGIQYVIDAGLYAVLISNGVTTLPANITSRASAAAIGFLLNRYVTFGQRNESLKRFGSSLLRFLLLWGAMTLISSLAVLWLQVVWGDDNTSRIIAKLMVEALLAVASYLASRFWVFRR